MFLVFFFKKLFAETFTNDDITFFFILQLQKKKKYYNRIWVNYEFTSLSLKNLEFFVSVRWTHESGNLFYSKDS